MFRAMLAAAMLLAIGLSSSVALAQSQMTFFGEVGFAKMMEDGAPGGSIGFGVGMTVPLPFGEAFTGGPEIDYLILGEEGDFSWAVIPVTGQAYYTFPTSGAVSPYATAGLGFYNTRVKVDIG